MTLLRMTPKVVFRSSRGYICAYIHVYTYLCVHICTHVLLFTCQHINTHMKEVMQSFGVTELGGGRYLKGQSMAIVAYCRQQGHYGNYTAMVLYKLRAIYKENV